MLSLIVEMCYFTHPVSEITHLMCIILQFKIGLIMPIYRREQTTRYSPYTFSTISHIPQGQTPTQRPHLTHSSLLTY